MGVLQKYCWPPQEQKKNSHFRRPTAPRDVYRSEVEEKSLVCTHSERRYILDLKWREGRGDTMHFLSEPVSLKVAVRKVTEKKERLTATTFKQTFFITLERKRAERSLHLI